MVTDSQYEEMKLKISSLEKKVNDLSLQLSRLILKGEATTKSKPELVVSKKDITKYIFDGKIYSKRGIVRECIKKFIFDNNIKTYEEFNKTFPNYLQGSLGVIRLAEEAEKYSNAHRRFYFSDKDIVMLDGKQYVICSQWDKNNIPKILKIADALGYLVQSVSNN